MQVNNLRLSIKHNGYVTYGTISEPGNSPLHCLPVLSSLPQSRSISWRFGDRSPVSIPIKKPSSNKMFTKIFFPTSFRDCSKTVKHNSGAEESSIDLNDIETFMTVDDWREVSEELITVSMATNADGICLRHPRSHYSGRFQSARKYRRFIRNHHPSSRSRRSTSRRDHH